MLSKKNRLTFERDILKTRKGESVKGSFFVMRAIKNNLRKARIVVTVGKKVSLKSVERNLIKRRTLEVIRLLLNQIDYFDIFVFALPRAKSAQYKAIENEIKQLFNRLKIIK